ncbi:DUF7215 family protein [Streptodolium elevatio]
MNDDPKWVDAYCDFLTDPEADICLIVAIETYFGVMQ